MLVLFKRLLINMIKLNYREFCDIPKNKLPLKKLNHIPNMAKILSLVQLISSLSKAERKKISSVMDIQNNESDYARLYKIIEKDPYADLEDIKFNFRSQRPSCFQYCHQLFV